MKIVNPSDLLATLNQSKALKANDAGYETIKRLIALVGQNNTTINQSITNNTDGIVEINIIIGGLTNSDYVTWQNDLAKLPNSRLIIAGTNITFDTSVSGQITLNVTAFASANDTFLTSTDEHLVLPNSREVLAGTNITFDDTVPNQRTINASGGGSGITQLTGDVTAGPGSGSQVATIPPSTVTEAQQNLSNNTTNDVSITKHGYAPIAPNDATKFLDGTGAYSVPSTGGTSEFPIVVTANKTLDTNYGWVIPESLEISAGIILEIADGARLEITGHSNNNFIGTRVIATVVQAIPDTGNLTTLNFDTVIFDSNNYFNSSFPNRLTVTIPGYYLITAACSFAASSTGLRRLMLVLNQITVLCVMGIPATSLGGSTDETISTIAYLSNGDYIQAAVRQSSGGNLNTVVASFVTNPTNTQSILLTVSRIGG